MILIFREHSAQNNVQGSARIAWSCKRNCNDMMISLQEKTTQAIRLAPMAECRLYKIAHLQSSRSGLRLPYFNAASPAGPRIIESDSGVISRPRHCSLRPTPHMIRYRQAAACPRAAQKSATFRSLRSPQWQSWCRRQAQFNSHLRCGCPNAHVRPRAPSSARPAHRKAKAMQVPSRLPGELLKGVADAKENCEKIEVAAEEMVGADTDAAFESACRLIVMKSLPEASENP